MNPSQTYLVAQVQSATPGGLIVLLYDGLLRFMQQAEEHLQDKSNPSHIRLAAASIQRATDILAELASALRKEQNPELGTNLSGLYAFFTTELSRSLHARDHTIITPLLPLVLQLRDAWADAETQLSNQAATTTG